MEGGCRLARRRRRGLLGTDPEPSRHGGPAQVWKEAPKAIRGGPLGGPGVWAGHSAGSIPQHGPCAESEGPSGEADPSL